ncbi:hypothetical protein [Pseudomonas sp. MPR-ANC1]|uniref:hypothetical protein n=1 Tax=Pseudomonas sp. MPR-ANC1 TaxID=2075548 RepID=UPI0011AFBAB0|nr:hypothetical protein [Pseudomonas sp. MPR-ANC1]
MAIRAQLGQPAPLQAGDGPENKNGVSDTQVGPHTGDAANGPGQQQVSDGAVAGTVSDERSNITPSAITGHQLITGLLPQKNGGVLVMGDVDALDAYAHAYLDQAKYTKTSTGLLLSKSQARLAQYLPSTQEALPSGAIIYSYAEGGVSVAVDGELSGIARNLPELKSLMAQRWGPEKYRKVFGEDAAQKDVQAYEDEQAAIAQRKQDNIDTAAQALTAQQQAQDLEKARKEAEANETARIVAERQAQERAEFDRTIGAGVSENPIYQAYLDTLEELPTQSSNAGFLGWAGIRAGEFERQKGGRISANKDEYLAYVRQWADEHLAERVKGASAASAPRITAKGNPIIDEAVLADLGLVREVFGRWKYRYAVGATELFATTKEGAIEQGSDAYAKADPSELLTKEQRWEKSNADFYADFDARYGKMSIEQVRKIMESAKPDAAGHIAAMQREFAPATGRSSSAAMTTQGNREGAELARNLERYLAERQAKEGASQVEPVTDSAPPATPQHEIIEYTTKRDKVLRGIIRTDLTLAEAKEIDPYTWRMNGGYFIREKHLTGDTSAIQAAPTPVVLTPEQEAEKQERDTRAALERQQQAIASQVQKLRAAGDKAIAGGQEGMNADRKTNTHRRAGMAASAYARAAADEADGKTLNSIADAIEVGAAGPLTNLNSRAQLQELKSALTRAKYDSERELTYSEQLARRGQPFGAEILQHVSMPPRLVWTSWYKNAATTMAKKAAAGNSKLIAALSKLGARTERWALVNDGDIAITRKAYKVLGTVKEQWDLKQPMEMLARIERLNRMGITNDAQLQDACRALLPHLAEKQEESAVVKAERAIIGQKVGIDFFPTPVAVAHRMARLARISKGMRVLEPSAGNGNLADAAAAAGGEVDVIEISSQLRDILTLKGYTAVAHDFNTFTPDEPYKAILMNPPFSKRQDAEHIMRAYGMLASGGTLVAIAGEGVFFGQDQKAEQFRAWLDSHNADIEKLEGGTFQDNALLAQTSANARLIVLHK